MKVLLQRTSRAAVSVGGEEIARTGAGLVLLIGVAVGDTDDDARRMAEKAALLRVFENDDRKPHYSAVDVGADVLVVSQFTLLADVSRGRRPGFTGAAAPGVASELVEVFAARLEAMGLRVGRGSFGAHMQVELVNDGPMTIMLES